jgi:hypothetical protein
MTSKHISSVFFCYKFCIILYIMNYKQKYDKYKEKNISIMNKIGGTFEDNNDYLLYGTSMFYIDDIKKRGLDGVYNKKITEIMKKYLHKFTEITTDKYVNLFISEQEKNFNNKPSISLTGIISVAEEHSKGPRDFEFGASRFLETFEDYINKNKNDISKDEQKDFDTIHDEFKKQHPGIILAIKKNDFEDTKNINLNELDLFSLSEIKLNVPIPPTSIYIRKGKNDYVLLLSEYGEKYINKLIKDDVGEQKIIEHQRLQSLGKWKTKIIDDLPKSYSYKTSKEKTEIKVNYDAAVTGKYLDYMSFVVYNLDMGIDIYIFIRNIKGTLDYEIDIYKKIGHDIFIDDIEMTKTLKLSIDNTLEHIPKDKKNKIEPFINDALFLKEQTYESFFEQMYKRIITYLNIV